MAEKAPIAERAAAESPQENAPRFDRSLPMRVWYRIVQQFALLIASVLGGVRATGRENVPPTGGAFLVSNHLSYLDVFLLGLLLPRPLNYVARSTLFVPGLACFIKSVGGFAIQRDGMGASGFKETLRRLRRGGIVTLFPEGTRSRDGELAPLKPGIAMLVAKAKVPIIPAGIAGTFEAWPRDRKLPRPHALRVHYGRAIMPAELTGLNQDQIVALITERLRESRSRANEALDADLKRRGNRRVR